jgi:hypothetical protein
MAIRRRITEVFKREKAHVSDTQIKRDAINAGLNAVQKCWPDAKFGLGDILAFDTNTRANSKTNNSNNNKHFPNAIMNKCGSLSKEQVLRVYWTAVNKECKKYGKEHLLSGKKGEDLF